jgi:hypothetical protein
MTDYNPNLNARTAFKKKTSLFFLFSQDLPELFLGKPRPYSIHDIEKGMQARPIHRHVVVDNLR